MAKDSNDGSNNSSGTRDGQWEFSFRDGTNPFRDKARGRRVTGFTPPDQNRKKEKLTMKNLKTEEEVFKSAYALLEKNESLALDDDWDKYILCQQIVKWFISLK